MVPSLEILLDALLVRRSLPADVDAEAIASTMMAAEPRVVETPQSSCTRHLGYDADRRVLQIAFAHGMVHRYVGVPAVVFRALLRAPSIGRAYTARIKGRYTGAPVGRWREPVSDEIMGVGTADALAGGR